MFKVGDSQEKYSASADFTVPTSLKHFPFKKYFMNRGKNDNSIEPNQDNMSQVDLKIRLSEKLYSNILCSLCFIYSSQKSYGTHTRTLPVQISRLVEGDAPV